MLSLDPDLPVADETTVEASIAASMASERLTAVLLGIFAVLALGLASLGLYGVMALGVTQRTRELGIRLALGAQRSAVLGLVMRQGASLVGTGLGIGLLAALGLGHFLASIFYGIDAGDLVTLLWVGMVLAATALAACWVPRAGPRAWTRWWLCATSEGKLSFLSRPGIHRQATNSYNFVKISLGDRIAPCEC